MEVSLCCFRPGPAKGKSAAIASGSVGPGRPLCERAAAFSRGWCRDVLATAAAGAVMPSITKAETSHYSRVGNCRRVIGIRLRRGEGQGGRPVASGHGRRRRRRAGVIAAEPATIRRTLTPAPPTAATTVDDAIALRRWRPSRPWAVAPDGNSADGQFFGLNIWRVETRSQPKCASNVEYQMLGTRSLIYGTWERF